MPAIIRELASICSRKKTISKRIFSQKKTRNHRQDFREHYHFIAHFTKNEGKKICPTRWHTPDIRRNFFPSFFCSSRFASAPRRFSASRAKCEKRMKIFQQIFTWLWRRSRLSNSWSLLFSLDKRVLRRSISRTAHSQTNNGPCISHDSWNVFLRLVDFHAETTRWATKNASWPIRCGELQRAHSVKCGQQREKKKQY